MFFCKECGAEFLKWEGRCRFCSAWGTISAVPTPASGIRNTNKKSKRSSLKNNPAVSGRTVPGILPVSCAHPENRSFSSPEINNFRTEQLYCTTGIKEIDTLFSGGGGGITQGAAYLIAGEPGIGKSTFLLLLAASLKDRVLYISGEETAAQIQKRAMRTNTARENIFIVNSSNINEICSLITENDEKPFSYVFIDSIQMLYDPLHESPAGSPVQVRITAQILLHLCKEKNITLLLTGHITKSGDVAGPKVLEHMVDGTIFMHKQASIGGLHDLRVFKPVKNRFGSTEVTGIFIMTGQGLTVCTDEVLSPDLTTMCKAGTCLYPHFIGRRLFFGEIESLTVKTEINFPRRSAEGISSGRLARLLAILERYAGINLTDKDVYVQISGGLRSDDITCDASLIAAVYSSLKDITIPRNVLFLGEIGLSGEIKRLDDAGVRLKEISRFGNFSTAAHSDNPAVQWNISGITELIEVIHKVNIHL